jgi:hypothetical protein
VVGQPHGQPNPTDSFCFRVSALRHDPRAFLVVSSSSTSFQRASRRARFRECGGGKVYLHSLFPSRQFLSFFVVGLFGPHHVCSAVLVGLGVGQCPPPRSRDLVVFPGTVKGLESFS